MHIWCASYAWRLLSSLCSFLDLAKFNDGAKSIFFNFQGRKYGQNCVFWGKLCVNEKQRRAAEWSPVAPLLQALPILSPAFILITTCIISCESVAQQIENTAPRDLASCIYFPSPSIVLHSVFTAFLLLTLLFNTITYEQEEYHIWLPIIKATGNRNTFTPCPRVSLWYFWLKNRTYIVECIYLNTHPHACTQKAFLFIFLHTSCVLHAFICQFGFKIH